MNLEEVKESNPIRDIVTSYGYRINRAGFISCPFHSGDRTPSCKIYKDSFHCHACGADGDVIAFVEKMENCSFKDAFIKLGGTYDQKTERDRAAFKVNLANKKRTKEKKIANLKKSILQMSFDMTKQRTIINSSEPFSDEWCKAVDAFEMDYIMMQQKFTKLSEV